VIGSQSTSKERYVLACSSIGYMACIVKVACEYHQLLILRRVLRAKKEVRSVTVGGAWVVSMFVQVRGTVQALSCCDTFLLNDSTFAYLML